jgi:hypothetical protein
MKARVVALIETKTGKFARFFILGGNHNPGSQFIFDLPDEGYQIGDKVWFTPNKIVRQLSAPEDHTATPPTVNKFFGIIPPPDPALQEALHAHCLECDVPVHEDIEVSRLRNTDGSFHTCGSTKAPLGWHCTRELGHEGPCAAVRDVPEIHLPPYDPDRTKQLERELEDAAQGNNRFTGFEDGDIPF